MSILLELSQLEQQANQSAFFLQVDFTPFKPNSLICHTAQRFNT